MGVLVYASGRARREALDLLPADLVLEREVEKAILRGDVCAGRAGFVFVDEYRAVAKIKRLPGRLRDRPRQWLVVGLEKNRNDEEVDDVAK